MPALIAESYMSNLDIDMYFLAYFLHFFFPDLAIQTITAVESGCWTLVFHPCRVSLEFIAELLEGSTDEDDIWVETNQCKDEHWEIEDSEINKEICLWALELEVAQQGVIDLEIIVHVDFVTSIVVVVYPMNVALIEPIGLQG